MTETFVFWTPLREIGLEQLHLLERETEIVADSFILGMEETTPFRFWYQVRMDNAWRVRECRFQVGGEQGRSIHLYSDGQGHWTEATGEQYSALEGCIDIDITLTPFTNTLPIRRLALTPGESRDILVVYVSAPELTIRPVPQRYTCLEQTDAGGRYRYQGLETGNIFDLSVDPQGLVIDYPGLWQRVETPR